MGAPNNRHIEPTFSGADVGEGRPATAGQARLDGTGAVPDPGPMVASPTGSGGTGAGAALQPAAAFSVHLRCTIRAVTLRVDVLDMLGELIIRVDCMGQVSPLCMCPLKRVTPTRQFRTRREALQVAQGTEHGAMVRLARIAPS